MGWRPPLDLSAIPLWESGNAAAAVAGGAIAIPHVNQEMPVVRGSGPTEFSTCTELAVDEPVVIYDVNGYYRALGFRPPYKGITKRALKNAYMSLDGQNDPWKTYAFKRLLDDGLRRKYDRVPPDETMMDQYFWEASKREARRIIQQTILAGGPHLPEHIVLESMGVPCQRDWGTDEPVEPVGAPGEPLAAEANGDGPSGGPVATVPFTWRWGYFAWRSSCVETQRLATWQARLAGAFRGLGHTVRVAVGFVGGTEKAYLPEYVGDTLVIYLHEDVGPTAGLAHRAASDVVHMMNQ